MIRLFVLSAMVILPYLGSSQDTYRVSDHEITIQGTSNLMSWSADVENASGTFLFTLEDGKIVGVENADLQIEAESIEGSEGRRMNSKIYESLNTERHPNINFVLRDVLSLAENPGTARITSRGVLTVAGVSRIVDLFAVARVLPDGNIELKGEHSLNMTDFRIKPPTAMFGTLRTGDEVDIKFLFILSRD